jgi:hypothetical protein
VGNSAYPHGLHYIPDIQRNQFEYPMMKERKFDSVLKETDELISILFKSIDTAKKK